MKKKPLFLAIASLFALFVATSTVGNPLSAHADFGPKPNTILTFEGMETVDTYYVAPLAQGGFGPYWTIDEDHPWPEEVTKTAIDERFLAISDPDGYGYTTFRSGVCSGNDRVIWGYRPPTTFKVALYIPENDTLIVTETILERTTFDSYFILRLSGDDYTVLPSGSLATIPGTAISNDYHVIPQILGLVARMLITLMLEVGLAWLFKYRSKKQLLTIVLTNVVTQLALNVGLNVAYLFQGGNWLYWLEFALFELLVFIAEAVFYKLFFASQSKKDPQNFRADWAVVYALLANALSLGMGILLTYYWNFGLY